MFSKAFRLSPHSVGAMVYKYPLMLLGADYLPFAEIPSLRNMVLTGEDDGDMSYLRLTNGSGSLPSSQPADNSTVVPFHGDRGGGRGGSDFGGSSRGGFKPVYD